MATGDRWQRDGQVFEERFGRLVPIGAAQLAAEERARQMGPGEAFAESFQFSLESLGRGVQQLGGDPTAMLREREARVQQQALGRYSPIASFVGQAAPFVISGGVAGGIGMGARLGIRGIAALEAAVGAAEGFLPAQETVADRLAGAVLGGLAGGVGAPIGAAAGGLARSIRAAGRRNIPGAPDVDVNAAAQGYARQVLDAEAGDVPMSEQMAELLARNSALRESDWEDFLLNRADELGIQTTLGQRLKSRAVRLWEASIKSNPWTGEHLRRTQVQNQGIINAKALAALGEPEATTIDQVRLGAAAQRIGEGFQAIAGELEGVRLLPRGQARAHFRQARQHATAAGLRKGGEAVEILDELQRRMTQPGGVTGEEIMNLRSELSAMARQASKAAGENPQWLWSAIKTIDSAIAETASPEAAARYAQLREQWRVLEILERPNAINASGDINVKTVANALRRDYRYEYARFGVSGEGSQGEFLDAIRVGAHMADIIGDSGTATRLSSQMLLDGGLMRAFNQLVIGQLVGILQGVRAGKAINAAGAVVRNATPSGAALGGAIGAAAGAASAQNFTTRDVE